VRRGQAEFLLTELAETHCARCLSHKHRTAHNRMGSYSKFGVFALPPELRETIYVEALEPCETPIWMAQETYRRHGECLHCDLQCDRGRLVHLQLHLVSRQVREEAKAVFIKKHMVYQVFWPKVIMNTEEMRLLGAFTKGFNLSCTLYLDF